MKESSKMCSLAEGPSVPEVLMTNKSANGCSNLENSGVELIDSLVRGSFDRRLPVSDKSWRCRATPDFFGWQPRCQSFI